MRKIVQGALGGAGLRQNFMQRPCVWERYDFTAGATELIRRSVFLPLLLISPALVVPKTRLTY